MYLDSVEEARKIIERIDEWRSHGGERATFYLSGHLERFKRAGRDEGRAEIIEEIRAVCDQPRAE